MGGPSRGTQARTCLCLLLVINPLLQVLGLDSDKATDISRRIREEFRRSGFQWISPVLYQKIDKVMNVKPYMFLFTTASCSDCRDMLDDLAFKEDAVFLAGISSQFNCVLVLDDYNLEFGPEYAPYGHDYVPRVVFADPDGTVRKDIMNKRGDKVTPYYYNAREMLWGMHTMLESYHEELEPFPDGLNTDIPS